MSPVLSVAILGGFLAVDFRSSLKLMISQPICGGLLTGMVLGSTMEGFVAGALFQMLFLGFVTVRGEKIPDLPVGGIAAAALYILSSRSLGNDIALKGIVMFWSFLVAIIVTGAGQYFYVLWEKSSTLLTGKAFDYVKEGKLRAASSIHLSILLLHFLYGFTALLILLPAGRLLIVFAAAKTGGFASGSFNAFSLLIPFIGTGSLIRLYRERSRAVWFAAGFLMTLLIVMVRG